MGTLGVPVALEGRLPEPIVIPDMLSISIGVADDLEVVSEA